MTNTEIPTRRQLDALEVIGRAMIDTQIPPSMREIGKRIGVTSTNAVMDHLKRLEIKGLIQRRELVSRGIRVTPEGWAVLRGRLGLSHDREGAPEDDARTAGFAAGFAAGHARAMAEVADRLESSCIEPAPECKCAGCCCAAAMRERSNVW